MARSCLIMFLLMGQNLSADAMGIKGCTSSCWKETSTRHGAGQLQSSISASGDTQQALVSDSRTADLMFERQELVLDSSLVLSGGGTKVQTVCAHFIEVFVNFIALIQACSAFFWREHGTSIRFLLAGAVAGIVSRTSTSPLEVLATMQMCGDKELAGGVFQQLKILYERHGITGFFRGNGANCLKVAPTRAIQFAVFERLKLAYLTRQEKKGIERSLKPIERLVMGGIAGMVASLLVYPLEVVKTKLTMNRDEYSGIIDAFLHTWRTGGFTALYRGLSPTLVAMFPYVGVEFAMYESLKALYQKIIESIRKANGRLPSELESIFWKLMFGAGAGAAAQTLAHPLDVVRKILQLQGDTSSDASARKYSNMFDGLYWLSREKGWRALYRGLRPACAATIPSTAVTYFVYEYMKKLLHIESL